MTAIDHPSPLGDEYFAYDDVGNLVGKKDGAAVVTAYEYDALNRLRKVDYNHGSWPPGTISSADVTYSYVVGSRLRDTMVDSIGTSDYDYDIHDRLTSYTAPSPANRVITYDYNNLNQKKWMELKENGASKLKVTYDYFRNGWLKEVFRGTDPEVSVAAYTYDAVGNRTKIEYGNPTYTVFAYDGDPRYRIEGVTHWIEGSPDSELLVIGYPYRDGAGNPERMMIDSAQTDYVYDENSRLDNVTYPDDEEVAFGYDWVGNRLNPPAAPNPMEYNGADQLTRWPTKHRYTYYDTGSLEYQKDDSSNIEKMYEYTPANLLSQVVHGDDEQNDPKSQMEWDADGNRVAFTSSTGGTDYFVYDPTAGIPAVVEEYDGSASIYYIREPGGELIARFYMEGEDEVIHYYHFDALGSTRLITDSSGTETDSYTYDAWGQQIDHTGSTAQPYRFVGQLGYYSHYQDSNLFTENDWQLLHLGVRFYDPELGRFTQVDPVGDDTSLYLYVGNKPTAHVDPLGLKAFGTCSPGDWVACAYACERKFGGLSFPTKCFWAFGKQICFCYNPFFPMCAAR